MGPRETTGADGVPAGTRLVLAPTTRRLGPGLVSGGSPWRLLRLTAAGDRWMDRWSVGRAVPEGAGARRLATRLVDAGLAWTRPDPDPGASVAVVIPCRDRPAGLAATLAALEPDRRVVVVDDGSSEPAETARVVAGRPDTVLVRREVSGGPGVARNDGWRSLPVDGPDACDLVAFLDTECIPPPGWLAALAGHFADGRVGAVAPRIATPAPPAPGWLPAYEAARSPLDLGPLPAPVRPRSTVPYVPSAALVVRRSALAALGGFDPGMPTGEDVDLVWRLDRAGWQVRYDPAVVVTHPVRPHLRSWLRQRAGYGRAAAPLAARHGAAVAPLAISRWSAAAWLLAGFGHPGAGAAVALASALRVAGRRPASTPSPATGPDLPSVGGDGRAPWPRAEIARLALRGHLLAGLGLADAVRRAWWPLAVAVAVPWRRARPALAAVVIVPALLEWRRLRPRLGPVAWTALRLADDLAYGAGVWTGVARTGQAGCLRPRLS